MVMLWEKRQKFGHVNDIKSYLYFMVRNASLAYLKKKKQVIPLDMAIHDGEGINDEQVIEEEVHAVLIHALDSLPDKCRKVFELSCLEGLKYKDIAEDMQISINTVKSQRARAIELLKKSLKDHPAVLLILWFL